MPDPNARTWRLPGGGRLTLHFAKPSVTPRLQTPDELCTSVTLTSPDGSSIDIPLVDDTDPPTWNAARPEEVQ